MYHLNIFLVDLNHVNLLLANFREFENLVYTKKPHLVPSIFEAYAKEKFIRWFEERVCVLMILFNTPYILFLDLIDKYLIIFLGEKR